MIPLRLTIKNFMCYRDIAPTLDLEGVQVACLCGENGHGKTALLDAITWTLWGQARARTQEELIHQGQRDMAVELEFTARDQRYRVSRRHSRTTGGRAGSTILELQVASNEGFRAITGNSVRETEAQIREILHMDYETFINTAFLQQGNADRFTTSAPSKRKECLAEVLDLSYYQALETRARERSHTIQERMQDLSSSIMLRQREISDKPAKEAQKTVEELTLAKITPDGEAQSHRVAELNHSVNSLRQQIQDLNAITSRLADAQREVVHFEAQVTYHKARLGEYETALEKERDIQTYFSALECWDKELARLDLALSNKNELDQSRAQLEREIAVQNVRFAEQLSELRKRVDQDLNPKAKRLPGIERDLQKIAIEQAALGKLEKSIKNKHDESREIAARGRYLEEANKGLYLAMEETRKKFNMLDQDAMLCPLCNQSLGPEGQNHLRREYESQGLDRKRQHQQNSSEQELLNQRNNQIEDLLAQQEVELKRSRQKFGSQIAHLERDKLESQEAELALDQAIAELRRLESIVSKGEFALNERKALANLEDALATLGYDALKHKTAREQVTTLARYRELHRKLKEAKDGKPSERKALKMAQQMLDARHLEIEIAQERTAALEEALRDLPSVESQLLEAQSRLHELDQIKQDTILKMGILKSELERYAALETELQHQEGEHLRLANNKSVYDELSVAFGKNGIQALIIETTIPQLEADANKLLGLLSENRMFLKLQLQQGRKDSRTGLPSEELEIRIADEVGTRSYETFSGGEAFRIDIALRISLSKMLARRSGAPLPILFIDEGFGSQDNTGQERLIEAIHSIQNEFQKILVITHIEQIKEAFPICIQVTKTSAGSTFQMV